MVGIIPEGVGDSHPNGGRTGNFAGRGGLLGGRNLRRSDFNHSNLFQS